MSSTVYQAIKASHRLPSPSGVALRVLELARNEEFTLGEIAAVVESDPAIALRLLKLVNSPLAGIPRQIASIQRAAAMLGVRAVTSLALGFSLVSENRRGRCSAFEYELFWSESVARAVAARHLANHLKNFAPDEAFTCGLLSWIGRLALATAFPQRYADVLEHVFRQYRAASTRLCHPSCELVETETSAFGIKHNELAAEMMADWHMPAIFCEAVRAQDAPDAGNPDVHSRACQFARILHLTGPIVLLLTQPTIYQDTLSILAEEAARQGITPYLCHEMLDAISREWSDAGTIFSVHTRQVPPLAEIYAQAQERPMVQDVASGASAGRSAPEASHSLRPPRGADATSGRDAGATTCWDSSKEGYGARG